MIFRRRPSTRTMLANAERNHAPEDDELDPDDPVVRLVRQSRAVGNPRATLTPRGPITECPTCDQESLVRLYASTAGPDYEICIGTYCPNCPPSEEDE